ncbi:MAG: diguanylate cyclase, partial [Actinomycetes bacterium]
VDDPVAAALRSTLMVHGDLTLTAGGTVVATTLAGPDAEQVARAAARGAESVKDGDMLVSADQPATDRKAGEPPLTVVVTAEEPTSGWLAPGIATVVLTALALAGVLGWRIARDLTRPLAELTAGAERVARGDLAAQIPVRSRDEVGRMAVAFNDMTERVRAQLDELARGRDALQANLDRVGGALALTHDLDGILDVVLDTAMSAVDAGAGAVYVGVHGGPMRARATRGLADDRHPLPDEMTPGVGVLGTVASTGVPVRGVLGEPGLEPGPGEPSSGTVLAAPLRRSSLIVGVLAVFAGQHRPHLTEADQETIRTLAAQASVAVDNVLLHEEAQRLSITDPLTGLWNFRYLSMSLNRELDRGSRFDRQVAVLMLDLDHFKDVNDTYGHQRGDAVLHELSHRVAEQIREVDTFARYGGEEFALVLPETDEAGSALVAERVCAAVRATPFGGPGETPLAVTVSIGCALFPQHGGNPTTLLRAADRALYAAKRAGRDRWRIVTVDVTESRPDRLPDASDRAPDASDRASGGSPQPGPDDRPGGAIGPSAEYARERGELPPHR